MNSEELYNLLTNFEEKCLSELGMTKEYNTWSHPASNYQFEVNENRLAVRNQGTKIPRLNASFDNPENLYRTFVDTGIIEPAVHFKYLKEQGLDL